MVIHAPLAYEVQIRTEIQHAWAQLSERLADSYGFELKYGGGPSDITDALAEYSNFGADIDRFAVTEGIFSGERVGIMRGYLEQLATIVEALKIQ